jgi:hypothetical protein
MWRLLNPLGRYNTKQAREKFETSFLSDTHSTLEKIADGYENPKGFSSYHLRLAYIVVTYNMIYERIYGDK